MIKREGSTVGAIDGSERLAAIKGAPFTIEIHKQALRIDSHGSLPLTVSLWNMQGKLLVRRSYSTGQGLLPTARIGKGTYLLDMQTAGKGHTLRKVLIP
jgi:hypothetical protein